MKAKTGRKTEGSLFLIGFLSLLWLIYRSGTKPSRIAYPCQKTAAANVGILFAATLPAFATIVLRAKKATPLALLSGVIIVAPIFSDTLVLAQTPNQEIVLTLTSRTATMSNPSTIYVCNGRETATISNLINLMADHGLNFYSLISPTDVVLIKINEEWDERGGTNTDVVKQLIQAIVDHPSGFSGEIIVCDNGQWQGSMDWANNNAEDTAQSMQDVVDSFSGYSVSTKSWMNVRSNQVQEYSDGDDDEGYVLYDSADPSTGIVVSYPKFTSTHGTQISFKHGVWTGSEYDHNKLKVINVPVLKSHSYYGVTGALKHYMGVQSEGGRGQSGLSNGHEKIATGGMGTLIAETRVPVLNIIDAIYINAIPGGCTGAGPDTPYTYATRTNVLLCSQDPVAIDYWAAKHVLKQASEIIGYTETRPLNPDDTSGVGVSNEAFGVWLPLAKEAMAAKGLQVTMDENQMNVYVVSAELNKQPSAPTVLSPNGGEIWGKTHNITWTSASDPDGDPLTYEVEYSTDGGISWQDLARAISATSFEWDTITYPSSTDYLIRIRASDGELSSYWDESNALFLVDNLDPVMRIASPVEGETVTSRNIWVNGSVIEANIGTLQPFINDTRFSASEWDGSTYAFKNTSNIAFGRLSVTVSFIDLAGNTGNNTVSFAYAHTYVTTDPAISIDVSFTSPEEHEITVAGRLTWKHNASGISNAPIVLSYKNGSDSTPSISPDQEWRMISNVTTGVDGNYSITWDSLSLGYYTIRSSYQGTESVRGVAKTSNLLITQFSNQTFSISSNSTLSDVSFSSTAKEINFTVSGTSGTLGWLDIFTTESFIPEISALKIYLDGAEVNFSPTLEGGALSIHFTYTHSTHIINVALSMSSPPSSIPELSIESAAITLITAFSVLVGFVLSRRFGVSKRK